MLQVYRVTSAFVAKQLDREPLWMESFDPGDLLVAMTIEGSYVTFCRHDDSTELSERNSFIVGDQEFGRQTETL